MIVALMMTAGLVMAADTAPAAFGDAPPAATSTTTAVAASTPAKPQKICKSVKTLGSRLPVKKCQTVEEAEAEKAEAQSSVRDMQRNAPPPEYH